MNDMFNNLIELAQLEGKLNESVKRSLRNLNEKDRVELVKIIKANEKKYGEDEFCYNVLMDTLLIIE